MERKQTLYKIGFWWRSHYFIENM